MTAFLEALAAPWEYDFWRRALLVALMSLLRALLVDLLQLTGMSRADARGT